MSDNTELKIHPPRAVAISLRPDSTIKLNVIQLGFLVGACLSGAFVSGVAYTRISNHIDDPNHPTAQQIQKLEQRIALVELALQLSK